MQKIIYPILILILLTSCISVKKNNVPYINDDQLKISSVKKTKIFLDWKFSNSSFMMQKQSIIDNISSTHEKIFSEVINKANCCEIVYGKDEADVVIKGSFNNKTSDAAIVSAFIGGYTFLTIPTWGNYKAEISAEVTKGNLNQSYHIKDSLLGVYWLPLILAMPFNESIFKVEEQMNQNLYKNLLVEMKNDKILR